MPAVTQRTDEAAPGRQEQPAEGRDDGEKRKTGGYSMTMAMMEVLMRSLTGSGVHGCCVEDLLPSLG